MRGLNPFDRILEEVFFFVSNLLFNGYRHRIILFSFKAGIIATVGAIDNPFFYFFARKPPSGPKNTPKSDKHAEEGLDRRRVRFTIDYLRLIIWEGESGAFESWRGAEVS